MDVDRERNGDDRDQRNGGDRYPPQDRRDRDAGGDRGRYAFPCLDPVYTIIVSHSVFHSRPEPEQQNPGNNLHVSGLSLDVEARDLEEYFGTVGKVILFLVFPSPLFLLTASPRTAATRSPRLRSCTTLTPALPVVSGSS
jgi:hypothetical protein